jgi:hypothetical protein
MKNNTERVRNYTESRTEVLRKNLLRCHIVSTLAAPNSPCSVVGE